MSTTLLSGLYPEDNLQPHMILFFSSQLRTLRPAFERCDAGDMRPSDFRYFSSFIYHAQQWHREIILNGRKPKNNNARVGGGAGQSRPVVWINIPLTDEDLSELERAEDSLEYLSCGLLELVGDGLSISAKFQPGRDNYCVSIYRPSDDSGLQSVGVSGFAPQLRDAILVALFRYHSKLGGQFPADPPTGASDQPKRRFG